MDLLDPLTESFDHATHVLTAVGAEQLDNPTPCTEWDVRALGTHVIGVVTDMGRGPRWEPLLADINAARLDDDLATQCRTEADRTLAAWSACQPDDEVDIGAGPMPVAAALSINLVDTTTHSWDIARATGQDAELRRTRRHRARRR